jgi:putrescine---pyruvate transaminase
MKKNRDRTADADVINHLHPMGSSESLRLTGPAFAERASGSLITIDGREYIDGLSGLGCVNVGYGDKRLCDAAANAMRDLSYAHAFGAQSNRDAALLAAKLASLTGDLFQKFFFGSSGSDAVETAAKIAYYYWHLRKQPGRRILLSREHSYHGNTIVASCLTGIDHYHEQFGLPLREIARHAPSPYWYKYGKGRSAEEMGRDAAFGLEKLTLEIGPENIAAFFGEPIQGTAGAIIPPANYWPEIRRICDKYEILLICDEVITGFGKVGTMFAYERFGFEPDMLVLAKGITSGYFPMSAVGLGQKVNEALSAANEPFIHGYTYSAHPVGAAVALANIGVIESENLLLKVRNEIEPLIGRHLRDIAKIPLIGEVRSMGVIGAIELDSMAASDAKRFEMCEIIAEAVRQRGVIVRPSGGSLVFILPINVALAEVDQVFAALKAGILEVAKVASNRENVGL